MLCQLQIALLPSSRTLLERIPADNSARCRSKAEQVYLHVACPSVKIEVKILDLAELSKLVWYILFSGFFVNICDEHNPALDRCKPVINWFSQLKLGSTYIALLLYPSWMC